MDKIAVIVDSGGDVSLELAEKYGIYFLPLYVNIDGEFKKDRIEITPQEFYTSIENGSKLEGTSLPTPADVISLLEKVRDDGYNKAIVVCITSKVSGTYNLCKMVDVEGIDVYSFDSKNLTMAQGFLAIYAKKLIDEGKSFEEVIEKLEAARDRSKVFFTIPTFKYIVEGGKVPKTFGKISDKLDVKPIITVNTDTGSFKIVKFARGIKGLLKNLYRIAEENLRDAENYYMFIAHGENELNKKLYDKIKDFADKANLLVLDEISPTLGANTGPGLAGFAFFKENE
ncbi:DegV family protein [Anaerococcus sp. AGMB09787]|uniref:DegV family protein n=1 Tax=Anaerococcus sp. AGMB09787 TaxID=2922869 RepID=UPI001FAF94DE|nr:DegV family protein [Anaerococcus sp. AGMB09787]